MLAINKTVALTYTKKPYKVCESDDPPISVYFVPDSALPALNVKCDPMSLITPRELYQLKKKYRAPASLLRKITSCYKKNNEEFELGDNVSLEHSLFISEIEDLILKRLKEEFRLESAHFLPTYPVEELGVRCYHTLCVGSSGVGKSWIIARILEKNFPQHTIYVFSPTASRDPAWKDLQATLGKKVKLIDSNDVSVPIPLEQLEKGSCLIIDDIESTQSPAKEYISALQNRCSFEGRHHTDKNGVGMIVFGVVHDAFSLTNGGLKAANIESSRIICFPNLNKSICQKLWSKRLHWTGKEIKKAFNFIKRNDRYCAIYTHVPNLLMTAHGVMLL